MRAVTIVDGALAWHEHPDPVPGAGEVLVAVRAAGLNSADRLQVAGLYPAPSDSPPTSPASSWPARWPPWVRAPRNFRDRQ